MFDPKFIDQLAQALIARLLPYFQNGNGKTIQPRLLTVEEAAKYLGRPSPSSIYHLVNRKEIPVVRHGRNLRFDRVELDRWIQAGKG